MLELLIIGFIFWLGYQVGEAVTSYRLRHIIMAEAKRRGLVTDKEIEKIENIDEPKTKSNVHKLWIETVKDTMYLYDNDTFICQAQSLEELAKLALKYKNIKYASVKSGENLYAFVNGDVSNVRDIFKDVLK